MPYTPIIGTLGYVMRDDHVLLVHRNKRAGDEHLGKWNGIGGKLEADEDVASGFAREVAEEAGLVVRRMEMRGTISWPGFGAHGEDWFGPIFLVHEFEGEPPGDNDEGDLVWVPLSRLLRACSDDPAEREAADLPMWEGDRHFVPLVFDGDPRAFHGVMPYRDGRPVGWKFSRI